MKPGYLAARQSLRGAAVLLPLALLLAASAAVSTPPNTWRETGNMTSPRTQYTLTSLPSGNVLAAGGCATFFCNSAVASAELYNPTAQAWSTTASMSTPRVSHTATLLNNGKVLVAGGCTAPSQCTALASVEIYDPSSQTWSPAGSLNVGRYSHTATRLADGRVLVSGGISVCNSLVCNPLASAEIYDPATNRWTITSAMSAARVGHASALLNTGQVLVAGGCSQPGLPCPVLGAELFNPSTGAWSPAAAMLSPRTSATATAMLSGQVLLAGGLDGQGFFILNAERYNPSTAAWVPSGGLTAGRFQHTATLLGNGMLLVAGGATASAEVYSPAKVTWTATGTMTAARSNHAAALLSTGDVLVAGGMDTADNVLSSAELYHPGSSPQMITVTNNGTAALVIGAVAVSGVPGEFQACNCPNPNVPPGGSCAISVVFSPVAARQRSATLSIQDNAPNTPQTVPLSGTGFISGPHFWAPTGTMSLARQSHTVTSLANQKVLVAGGASQSGTELYDPGSGTFSPTGPLNVARSGHTATRLLSGKVLVAGGGTASAEIYDPGTGLWSLTGSMSVARTGHTATLLPGGQVLVSGGCNGGACNSAELFDPASGKWTPTGSMNAARAHHTATLLASGRVLAAGGGPASAELYDPGAGAWTPTGSMSIGRAGHTATRLASGKVLAAGGCGGGPCSSAEVYDPTAGTWTPTAPMKQGHVSHTATRLANGQVLVAGGIYFCDPEFGFCFTTAIAELYQPATNSWTLTGAMITPRDLHAAALLPTGKVLVTGGTNDQVLFPLASAELYTP